MPKKMPKPEAFGSIKGILDQGYADAMENLTEGMKKAAIQGLFSPTDPERNFGMYKRTVRMLLSQGDNFIVDFLNKVDPKTLTDPKIAKDFATTVANKLGGFDAQKAMNYAAGIIEGHHGVSVDSIFSAAKHLPMKDRLEFIRTLSNEYGVSGTVGGDMYPVSRFAHQGKGTGSVFPKASAHTTANPLEIANSKGFPVNTGTWSREFDFSDITDPRKLADAFMQQSGFPQMAMADQAFDSPEELGIRKELAERLGIRERDLYTKSKDFNPRGQAIQKKIKELGIDVQEMVHRHYGLPYTPRAPLVKDPNAPKRIPKPTVAPTFEEASQFAKGWFDEADFLPTQAPVAQLMPTKVARNPLMRGAKAISRAIPGPADALIPGVVGGGLALAGGATLPQAAEAFGSGVAEGLTGDIDAGPLANNQAYVVNGQQRFINQRNELVDQPGYGLQQRNGNWEVVKRGTGVAAQQERQDNQQMMQQASNLIPKVNRAMNPVGAKITNEAQYFIINPLQKAFKNVFGNREI
jgi:hypothetical protein